MCRKLTDQADPDHRDNVAKTGIQIAYSVHCDCPDGCVTGFFVGYADGDSRRQVERDDVDFGMIGQPGPGDGNSLPDIEPAFQPGPDCDHFSGRRISQRQRFIKPGQYRPGCRSDAVAFGLGENLPYQVGPRLRLAGQAFAGKFDDQPFGPRRNQRGGSLYHDMSGPDFWFRHLVQGQLAGSGILNQLFHPAVLP